MVTALYFDAPIHPRGGEYRSLELPPLSVYVEAVVLRQGAQPVERVHVEARKDEYVPFNPVDEIPPGRRGSWSWVIRSWTPAHSI